MNGDQQEDVVGAWQGASGLVVKVYVGSGSGFVADGGWTEALGTMGKESVSAMAVGDLDTDGYADVVVAKGLRIEAYQNVAGDGEKVGKMVKAWSGMVDPSQAGPEVQSVTMGRLGGGDKNVSPDVVAATYTECTAAAQCDVYLHSYRALN